MAVAVARPPVTIEAAVLPPIGAHPVRPPQWPRIALLGGLRLPLEQRLEGIADPLDTDQLEGWVLDPPG